MSKYMSHLLRHKEVGREENARVPHDRFVEKNAMKVRRCNRKIKHGSVLVSEEVGRRSVKRWWTKQKGLNTVWNQIVQEESCTFEPFKVIQEKLILEMLVSILHCNTMHCYQRIFTKYVHHVGNGKELRSTMRNRLVPRGFSTKTGRHAVFFTVMDPMDDEQGLRETFCDLSKARIEPHKNTWKPLQDTVHCCNLILTQEGGLQFYQTRSNAVVCDTLPAEFIEKRIRMKTEKKKALPKRKRQTTCCSQSKFAMWKKDLPRQEARSFWKTQSDAQSFLETGWNIVDYRVPSISLSTSSTARWKKTTQLRSWSRSSNHISTKNNFLKVWVRRRRSTSSVKHRKNCFKIWTRQRSSNFARILQNINVSIAIPLRQSGLFNAIAGEIWSTGRSPATFKKDNCDFNSIPGYIIKKNSNRGPKHGQSGRQIMFFKAKDMLRKAQNKENGHHPTILSRWKADEEHRKSSVFIGIGEKEIMHYDRSAFEKHDFFSYESWTNTKFKALGYLYKCWRTSTTSTTTPRLCRR